MKQIIILVAIIGIAVPQLIFAETVLRSGENISVEAEQVVKGDYYVSVGPFGKTVMSGAVEEDMLAFGASVVLNGAVGKDVLFLGGTVDVLAPVGDDVRIAGGEVVISDTVGGDVFVLGGSVSILSTAVVEGDVFVFAGDVLIEGDVKGSVFGKVEQMTINATVDGGVDVHAPIGIMLADKAVIRGDISYASARMLTRSPQAVIEGAVHEKPKDTLTQKEQMRSVLIPLFILLFTVLSLYLLCKTQMQQVVQTVYTSPGKSILLGFALLLLAPVASVLLLVSVIGLFVGVLTFSVLVALYVAAAALSGAVFGVMLAKLFDKQANLSLPAVVFGTVFLYSTFMIPVIGVFLSIVLWSVTLGAMGLLLYRRVA